MLQKKIIDASSSRMILVEAPKADLEALLETMPDWIMTPEQMIPLPDPRPKLSKTE